MKKMTAAILVLALVLTFVSGMTFASVPDSASEVTLYAGQNIDVGKVSVWNDDETMYVMYKLSDDKVAEGWYIKETHLHAADSLSAFPVAGKQKNPVPGLFTYGDAHGNVTEYLYEIPLDTWAFGTKIYIGAHAVIEKAVVNDLTKTYTSDPGMNIYGPVYAEPAVDTVWGDPVVSVEAVNNIPNSSYVWGKGNDFNPSYDPDIDGVKWISTAASTEQWTMNSWRKAVVAFNVDGSPSASTLKINSDNQYWVYLNGTQIGTDGDIWNGPESYGFTPTAGANEIVFIWKNLGQGGEQVNNPNGITFKADINYSVTTYMNESAWGAGTRFTTQGSWATYFCYTLINHAPVLIATIDVKPDGKPYFTTNALETGKNYRIVASGTYRFANWGEYGIADAAWNYRSAAYAPGGVPGWYQQATTKLQVWVDGSAVAWDPSTFNPEHIYSFEVTGTDSNIYFSIEDSAYGDNSGSIKVDIYWLP